MVNLLRGLRLDRSSLEIPSPKTASVPVGTRSFREEMRRFVTLVRVEWLESPIRRARLASFTLVKIGRRCLLFQAFSPRC